MFVREWVMYMIGTAILIISFHTKLSATQNDIIDKPILLLLKEMRHFDSQLYNFQ